MRQNTSHGNARRLLSPTEDSSWAHLRWLLTGWIALGLFWISWQFWGDAKGLQRLLGILLPLIALTQSLSTIAIMRRKKAKGLHS